MERVHHQNSEERLMRVDSTTSRSLAHSGIHIPKEAPRPHEELEYEINLKGLKRITLVTDITMVCNWSLGFCALTWASAVLLGAYVTELSIWQYYDVSVLLFVEGLRFAVAAVLRTVGIHRLGPGMRWFFHSAGIFIPLWMGGFALLSIMPTRITQRIRNHFLPQRSLIEADFSAPLAPYGSLPASLTIFYSFILANAFVLLLGRFISGLMHLLYVRHNGYPSINKYHDKMILDSSGAWMQAAGVDLNYAFQMQSFEYKRRRTTIEVCKHYVDLIEYLYMHEKGMEAVEAALGEDDVYVREAAANIVGFFAVLEELQPAKNVMWNYRKNVPLCYQMGMLSKLADQAAGGYSPTSTAAARSFALLLEANQGKPEMICKLQHVRNGEGEVLVDILLQRYREMMEAGPSLRKLLQEKSDGHLYALIKLMLYWRREPDKQQQRQSDAEAERAEEIMKVRKEIFGAEEEEIESGGCNLEQRLLSASQFKKLDDYYADIKAALEGAHAHEGCWKHNLKIGIFLLVNVALPLTLGFIVKAYLRH